MLPLHAEELLDVWERGAGRSALDRSLVLLSAASPEIDPAGRAALTVGERDAALLGLREATFGPRAEAVAPCPDCGALVEFEFAVDELHSGGAAGSLVREDGELRVAADGFEVRVRLPTVADVSALSAGRPAAGSVRAELLRRCVIEVRRGGVDVDTEELSPGAEEAIEAAMASADPDADISFALTCAECGRVWSAPFDVSAFVWAEIEARARRLLAEVDALASAYGWSEGEIVALSPRRRQAYLELSSVAGEAEPP